MKKLILIALTLMTAFTLTACAGKELPEDFNEEKMEEISIKIIEEVNQGNFDGLYSEYASDKMKTEESEENIKDAIKKVSEKKGIYHRFERLKFMNGKNPEKGKERLVVAIVNFKHENKDVLYTLSYDNEDKLVGFYLK